MNFYYLLTLNMEFKLLFFFLMGACFGSLLNVIVVRLPIMLIKDNNFGLNLNLMYPRSMCMSCKNRLRLWQNIPLISYLILRGKCFYCENKFGIKYFIIELLTAISFMLVAYYNNDLLIILAQCCFIFFVVAITLIDFKYFIIPDELSLSMLWLGLIFNINGLLVNDVKSSILGAVLGYIFFYLLASVYRLLTKKEGIGQGDFKLFAAILAWIGVDMFIPMLLLAPLLAIIYFIIIKLLKNVSFNEEIPFGPFLSIAGLFIMFNMKYILNLLY